MADDIFADLRPAVRARLAAAVARLRETGRLSRADIAAAGEVSPTQASTDIATIMDRMPGLMIYDHSARVYRLAPDPHRAAVATVAGRLQPRHDLDSFAGRLGAWADRHRGTQGRVAWVADATGLPAATVAQWFAGRTPAAAPLVAKFMDLYDARYAG